MAEICSCGNPSCVCPICHADKHSWCDCDPVMVAAWYEQQEKMAILIAALREIVSHGCVCDLDVFFNETFHNETCWCCDARQALETADIPLEANDA